jgi:hypothetical protein
VEAALTAAKLAKEAPQRISRGPERPSGSGFAVGDDRVFSRATLWFQDLQSGVTLEGNL